MDDIKGCPFCGNKPIIKPYSCGDKEFYIVSCAFCNAEINDPTWTVNDAVEKWNKRHNEK